MVEQCHTNFKLKISNLMQEKLCYTLQSAAKIPTIIWIFIFKYFEDLQGRFISSLIFFLSMALRYILDLYEKRKNSLNIICYICSSQNIRENEKTQPNYKM